MEGVEVVFHLAALASVQRSVEAPADSHRICATGTLQVLDAAGKPMRAGTSGRSGPNFDGITMQQNLTMNFAKGAGAPAKLIVTGPRPLIVEVPFVMENVPLP